MITRGYATNWDMDELGWIIGVVQTRPHDAATVMTDLAACDRQADNAKSATVVPPLTPAQESVIGGQARARGYEGYHRRPTATRMLVSCLQGRGYAVTPWVPMNAPREYGLQLVTTAKALGLTHALRTPVFRSRTAWLRRFQGPGTGCPRNAARPAPRLCVTPGVPCFCIA